MSVGNPFVFNNWLNPSGNGGDGAGDDGMYITMTQNTAEQNVALWCIYQRSRVENICSSFKEGSNGC